MDLQTFLDNLDINNLSNLAPELLEYDDDDGKTPQSSKGCMTPEGANESPN